MTSKPLVTQETKITKKDLMKVFWRSIPMEFTWNYERQMHLGYCYALLPVLKKLYKEEDLSDAMVRHMEFYNTTPFIITLPLGISAAMEELNAKNPETFDKTSVSTVKTALMGRWLESATASSGERCGFWQPAWELHLLCRGIFSVRSCIY